MTRWQKFLHYIAYAVLFVCLIPFVAADNFREWRDRNEQR
jgi:hypothetical protein